jgi:hypothetical protein
MIGFTAVAVELILEMVLFLSLLMDVVHGVDLKQF